MTIEKLAQVIGDVDDRFILEAIPKKRVPMWKIILPLAATLMILAAAGSIYGVKNYGMGRSSSRINENAECVADKALVGNVENTMDADVAADADLSVNPGYKADAEICENEKQDTEACVSADEEKNQEKYVASVVFKGIRTGDNVVECTFSFPEFTYGGVLTMTVDDASLLEMESCEGVKLLKQDSNTFVFESVWGGTESTGDGTESIREGIEEKNMPTVTFRVNAGDAYYVSGVFSDAEHVANQENDEADGTSSSVVSGNSSVADMNESENAGESMNEESQSTNRFEIDIVRASK